MCALTTCLSLAFFPLLSNGSATDPVPPIVATTPGSPVDSTEAKTMILRLNEIKAMDKSELKASEKKVLRKEVKEISNKLGEPYIYISAAGAIIIILLLILLF